MFTIALLTYWLTMERTASYWDCGEFIAVSYKLEVPHPPGAPLFLLIGRLFSFLSFGDTTQVAYWINFSSVLSSAFTILFLFWSITLLGRKIMGISKPEQLTPEKSWILAGAGLVGSLAYTFSDSFWFSAVEAEVYAMSSFFTAFVVWAMLKWEVIEDESKANRWLVLIFYMMGLSIGVHLLNLVAIPALGLIYYFKKYKPTVWGIIFTLGIGGFLIILINDIIIPGLPSIAGNFEVFFVNSLGLPFGSGVVVITLIVISGLVAGIYLSQKNSMPLLNTSLLAATFILIGYSSYAVVLIRSNYDTPINENDPSDVMTFVSYLKREQYGSRPLLYGQYFTAKPIDLEEGAPTYRKGKDKYEIKDRKLSYKYDPKDMTILPRMWSGDAAHQERYRSIMNLREGEKPSFIDNMAYMVKHQIGWMYVRYFMFNFAGRESDNQDADWLSPFSGSKDLPFELATNKGRNNYFMIPFILGLMGMFHQSVKDTKNFVVVMLLFVLMGAALVVYLNSPPTEPRERDYIYAGSYYAFCFWIGFAVIWMAEGFMRFIKNHKVATVAATLIGLSAPALMAQQGWDDHNRDNRYFSVDSAINYLQSCQPNAVLYTGGDNDTFPLWYSQEVEGVRTDMRVVVLSYYMTDWYIEQTMQKHYESEPLPYTLTIDNYRSGGLNDFLPYYDAGIKSLDLKQYLDLLKKNYKGLLHPMYGGQANMLPSKEIVLTVDVDKVRRMGIVPKSLDSLIVPQMRLRVRGNSLEKKDLAMLDVLATTDWERPVYVNNTSLAQFNIDLRPYIVQEGNTYRILPVLNPNPNIELVNTELSYENMLKKFQFRGLDDPNVYNSSDYRSFVLNHRSSFNALAEALISENQEAKAREVLLFSLEKMPDQGVAYDYTSVRTAELLLELGEKEKAEEMAVKLTERADQMAGYLIERQEYGRDLQINMAILGELQQVLFRYGLEDLAQKTDDAYKTHSAAIQALRYNPMDF